MTVDVQFEAAFEKFVANQKKGAKGMRLEMLNRDLKGTKKMFKEVLWPITKSFEGFILEYEFVNAAGVTLYIDAFFEPLGIAFESEGFVVHAGNITRDRFDFERGRIRQMANYGYIYFPFSWDELDKKPEVCRASVYELFGRYGTGNAKLSVSEKEVLRYALRLNRPFRMSDVCECLGTSDWSGRNVVRSLLAKNLVIPYRVEKKRVHAYIVNRKTMAMLNSV